MLKESDDASTAALVRFLFVSAMQPFLNHMSSWVYSTNKVEEAFADDNQEQSSSLAQLPANVMVGNCSDVITGLTCSIEGYWSVT